MAKKRGLGAGVENLIPAGTGIAANLPEGQVVQQINITKIEPNKDQARKKFDEDALSALAESIKQEGVIEPILVVARGDMYHIVAGERRWRAAHLAGIRKIPAIVLENKTDQELAVISLLENLQREGLNDIEEAQGYQQLIEMHAMTQDEVAKKLSRSRTAVTNTLRLLKLSPEVQQMIVDEKLTAGHARTLIPIEDPAEQLRLAEQIFDENLSVRQAEKLVKSLNKPKKPRKTKIKNHNLEAVYQKLEVELTEAVGTRVQILSDGEGKGKLEIDFYNNDDLEKIVDRLRMQA
ncbi:MAG: ParB/RepB/Spo0J family partition protein [Lachnospiraceae bacterium]|nr:ParB/RepB/Spo0J family partition protein [Lachnospiraceae bacterium]